MAVNEIDERLVRQTIELARRARQAGNHPFGALLALDEAVLLTAQNTIATDRDPTAHAESNLVAEAIRRLTPEQIRRSVLYSSCEPCAMCVGKMYWAGIRWNGLAELTSYARSYVDHDTVLRSRWRAGCDNDSLRNRQFCDEPSDERGHDDGTCRR